MPLIALTPAAPPSAASRDLALHLRLPTDFDDSGDADQVLDMHLSAALTTVERLTSRAVITRQHLWRVSAWRSGSGEPLPLAPVTSVDGIVMFGPDGAITPVDPGDWRLDQGSEPQRLFGRGCAPPPTIPPGGWAEVTFSAGYGGKWSDAPEDLRQAVLKLAAHAFQATDGAAEDAPADVTALLAPYRPIRL